MYLTVQHNSFLIRSIFEDLKYSLLIRVLAEKWALKIVLK